MSPKEPGCVHRSFFTDASAKDNTLHIIQMGQNNTNLNETKTQQCTSSFLILSESVSNNTERERDIELDEYGRVTAMQVCIWNLFFLQFYIQKYGPSLFQCNQEYELLVRNHDHVKTSYILTVCIDIQSHK
jgi:hypothetical protein